MESMKPNAWTHHPNGFGTRTTRCILISENTHDLICANHCSCLLVAFGRLMMVEPLLVRIR